MQLKTNMLPTYNLMHSNSRLKISVLLVLIFGSALIQDLRWVTGMLAAALGLYAAAGLSWGGLWRSLRYPSTFLIVLGLMDILTLREEGALHFLLIAGRFMATLILAITLFQTTSLLMIIKTLRAFGLPQFLADMLLLTSRYIFEIGESFHKLQIAARLRGFQGRSLRILASLAGSLLVYSQLRAERVYQAMRTRGYGGQTATAPQTVTRPALEISDLDVSYGGDLLAVAQANLKISSSEHVGIIGANGSGKTTLFLAVSGILKPKQGTIDLFGKPVQSGVFRPEVGVVFQNPDDQLFSMTVQDDVRFAPSNLGLSNDEIEERVHQALRITGTESLADRPPHQLSGGEKRMVAIAGILAMQPSLILLDEPDAYLDIRSRRMLIQFLQSISQTLMIASHDLELILEVCTRVIVLDGGQIVADGLPRDIMSNAAFMESHGLEKPHSLIPHPHL